jgi:autoinducer 2-degrading protein
MTNKAKTAILAILFRVDANPGVRQELVKFLQWNQKESMEQERGTLLFDVFQDPENENRFYVSEVYEDAAAFEEHQKHEAFKRWFSDEFQKEVVHSHLNLSRVPH